MTELSETEKGKLSPRDLLAREIQSGLGVKGTLRLHIIKDYM